VHAHEEAAQLLAAALDVATRDDELQPLERYELLMARAQAARWAGDVDAVQQALEQAVDEAQRLGDVERVAAAAITTTQGMLWTARAVGVVDERIVRTLQDVLHRLPPTDSELRCRVLLVLASELYYADGHRHQRALVDEGLAMARRLADPSLRWWACLVAATALWRPANRAERFDLAEEAVRAAESADDATARVHARVLRAITAMETGRIEHLEGDVSAARVEAEQLRLLFPLVVLDTLHLPWLAMGGRFDEAEELLTSTLDTVARTNLEPKGGLAMGALLPVRLWQGRAGEMVDDRLEDAPISRDAYRLLLLRSGRVEDLRSHLARYPLTFDTDDWHTPWQLAVSAELALVLGLRTEAATAYARLAPMAGSVAAAGSGAALGPVDAFLALAAAAAGERSTASRHADDATALCEAWGIPLVAAWLDGHRRRAGF
jgi:hypothetical protein